MAAATDGTVYLLHISPPYRHAKHYLGWTPGAVADRLAKHLKGQGARLVAVAVAAGRRVELARTWPGGRTRERQLKRWHCSPKLCPVCRAG